MKAIGALDKAIQSKRRKIWFDVIADYFAASPNGFGKTKTANLAYLQRLDFGQIAVEDTDDHTFFKLAQDLLRGVQAPPADKDLDCPEHYDLKPREPQTVNSYMATLRTVVRYGGPISRIEMPIAEFETAKLTLTHQCYVARSAKRNHRPTLDEMNRLIELPPLKWSALIVRKEDHFKGGDSKAKKQGIEQYFAKLFEKVERR